MGREVFTPGGCGAAKGGVERHLRDPEPILPRFLIGQGKGEALLLGHLFGTVALDAAVFPGTAKAAFDRLRIADLDPGGALAVIHPRREIADLFAGHIAQRAVDRRHRIDRASHRGGGHRVFVARFGRGVFLDLRHPALVGHHRFVFTNSAGLFAIARRDETFGSDAAPRLRVVAHLDERSDDAGTFEPAAGRVFAAVVGAAEREHAGADTAQINVESGVFGLLCTQRTGGQGRGERRGRDQRGGRCRTQSGGCKLAVGHGLLAFPGSGQWT